MPKFWEFTLNFEHFERNEPHSISTSEIIETFFSISSARVFQVIFLSIVTPKKFSYSCHMILGLLTLKSGRIKGRLSLLLTLCGKTYLAFVSALFYYYYYFWGHQISYFNVLIQYS